MPPYLLAKDLILHVIGDISVSGANYRALQIGGEAIAKMSMEERMTLCNMAIEAGGKNGVIAPDQTTYDYVRSRTDKPFESLYADADASYYHVKHYDVSKLEPVVAKPHSPDNRALVREVQDVKIDRVYIGSCTGGKSEDFYHAAKLMKGEQVKVPTYLVPATQKVYNQVASNPLRLPVPLVWAVLKILLGELMRLKSVSRPQIVISLDGWAISKRKFTLLRHIQPPLQR